MPNEPVAQASACVVFILVVRNSTQAEACATAAPAGIIILPETAPSQQENSPIAALLLPAPSYEAVQVAPVGAHSWRRGTPAICHFRPGEPLPDLSECRVPDRIAPAECADFPAKAATRGGPHLPQDRIRVLVAPCGELGETAHCVFSRAAVRRHSGRLARMRL